MAERVARGHAARDGVRGVTFSSAGISAEEAGHPIDPRAAEVLRAAGYDTSGHVAHRVTADEVHAAGLVIGMETLHLNRIRSLVPDAQHLYLLTDFNPNAIPGSEVPDPWYGTASDFTETLASIEAAMPALMRRVRQLPR
jgi:protein-tyrosine phosphatase